MHVAIASRLLRQIVHHAAGSPDREVCGLLFGMPERIVAVEATANVHADPAAFFEVDPARLFAALRGERVGGARLIGHYHSHPTGRPEPSAADAAAVDPVAERLWLIVAGEDVAAFRAGPSGAIHGRFDRVGLVVKD